MNRSVPKLRGVSAAIEGNVVAVSAYDSLLLSRVFGALRPSLDGFLYSSGFTAPHRERILGLAEALDDTGARFLEQRSGDAVGMRLQPSRADGVLSSHDAAVLLGGLTAQRVGQLVREGQLVGNVVRGRLVVDRASVEALRAARGDSLR